MVANKNTDKVTIRLKGSLIGTPEKHIKIVKALGLKKMNATVEHLPSATIMGMVNKIPHLVEVVK
ncbi:50S ribosomal protein L30 [Candidatus Gastranaerophilus sp. (ex Termes propinquus)]|nr:50S ribosomal protein L30 [Candidatus Gastranaerophilus sp. (ex Termes propinquus)]